MTGADLETPSTSALRLVVTAERLFAQRGIDGVSLRQIAIESGSANNSAIHYHFGSKDGLITAIFSHRLPQLIRERSLLARQCDPADIRSRFAAHYLPVLDMAESLDNHYVTFVEQMQRRDLAAGGRLVGLPDAGRRSDEEFRSDLMRLLPHLDEDVRRARIGSAQSMCLHAAVDREHAVIGGAKSPPFDLHVDSLLDGITGFLGAASTQRVGVARLLGVNRPGPLGA